MKAHLDRFSSIRFFLAISFVIALLLTGCGLDPVIPNQGISKSDFSEMEELYQSAAEELMDIPYDCLISKTEYYRPDGMTEFVGSYVMNMEDKSFAACENDAVLALINSGKVKMIDMIRENSLTVISFSCCVPGRNYDYGFYYTSSESPVYLGDLSQTLAASGDGFVYEKKGSLGVTMSYYTERAADSFFYYEIS